MMEKEFGSISGPRKIENFIVLEPPAELTGLTPKTLYDLFDMGMKWGDDAGEISKTYWCFSEILGWGIKISVSAFNKAMTVVKLTSLEEESMTTEGIIPLNTADKGIVLWDRKLTVKEVEDAITGIDDLARQEGLIDDEGIRVAVDIVGHIPVQPLEINLPTPIELQKKKNEIEITLDVLNEKGIKIALTAEEVIANPEKLMSIVTNLSWDVISEVRQEVVKRLSQ